MPTSLVRLLIAAIVLLSVHATAFAQAVQVSPGYVRAPFTDVYSNDYDDDDDFDDDDRWLLRRRPPARQSALAPQQLATLDWTGLRAALAQAVANLDRDLSRMPTGRHWRERFRIAELASYAQIPNDGPPSEDVREGLYDSLDVFAGAQADDQLRAITRMRSFRDLQAVVVEYVTPPDSRLRLQLQGSSIALQDALGRFNTGDGWKKHLGLPDVIYVRSDGETGDVYPTEEDLGNLQAALGHFDKTSQDARYTMIANLPAFTSTHSLLDQYLAIYQQPPSAPGDNSAPGNNNIPGNDSTPADNPIPTENLPAPAPAPAE
jgi:hypothetical protein